jgi:myo-inositol 2-dehydrogenase/D-chiro-inositol 1-dehydrogenase
VPWLVDSPVVEASWHAGRPTSHVDGLQDPQLILLRTANGVLATVESFVNAGYGYDIRCEVVGETGVASIREPARLVIDQSRQRATPYAEDWRLRFADAYRLELQAWVDAVARGHQPPLATAREALIATAVADAVVVSMNSSGGRAVAVRVPDLAEAGR